MCTRVCRYICAVATAEKAREAPAPVAREEKSPLARKLGKQFVVSVELDPPKGADPATVLAQRVGWSGSASPP